MRLGCGLIDVPARCGKGGALRALGGADNAPKDAGLLGHEGRLLGPRQAYPGVRVVEQPDVQQGV
eukprot:11196009-Alexandrium_andersonii.AAC.1